jgi:hypothetical protein
MHQFPANAINSMLPDKIFLISHFSHSYISLRKKIEVMERKYDDQSRIVYDAIKKLLRGESNPKRKIGFKVKNH